MNKINSITEIMNEIQKIFGTRYHFLGCYFLQKPSKGKYSVFNYINSIPIIKYDADEVKQTIKFDMRWQANDKQDKKGWESINKSTHFNAFSFKFPANRSVYSANMKMVLRKVKSIHIYEWGFHIKTAGILDMYAILTCYIDAKLSALLEQFDSDWDPPFSSVVKPSFNIISYWDPYENAENIDDLDAAIDENKILNLGQNLRDLDI